MDMVDTILGIGIILRSRRLWNRPRYKIYVLILLLLLLLFRRHACWLAPFLHSFACWKSTERDNCGGLFVWGFFGKRFWMYVLVDWNVWHRRRYRLYKFYQVLSEQSMPLDHTIYAKERTLAMPDSINLIISTS